MLIEIGGDRAGRHGALAATRGRLAFEDACDDFINYCVLFLRARPIEELNLKMTRNKKMGRSTRAGATARKKHVNVNAGKHGIFVKGIPEEPGSNCERLPRSAGLRGRQWSG
jgi:hypothetical protein